MLYQNVPCILVDTDRRFGGTYCLHLRAEALQPFHTGYILINHHTKVCLTPMVHLLSPSNRKMNTDFTDRHVVLHSPKTLRLQGWRTSALKMKAVCSSETLVNIYQTTRCYTAEDSHLVWNSYLESENSPSLHRCVLCGSSPTEE
jgi:hypothetical protein